VTVAGGRCIHELPLAQCTDCRPRPKQPAREPGRLGRWIEARFRTECDGPCAGEIEPGDLIRSDGEGGWLCWDCGGGTGGE
jgi:hypothetical protein